MKHALLVLALALCACATEPAKPAPTSQAAVEAAPGLRLPTGVRPSAYRLALEVRPDQARFAGSVEIDVALDAARSTIWLHGRDLAVSKALVRAGGREVAATYKQTNEDGLASLSLAEPVGPGPATLRLEYSAPFGERNDGLYKVPFAGDVYAVTQFEAISARMALPCFDEPGFKAPLELELTIREGDVALANLPVQSEEKLGNGLKRVRFQRTPPLSSYLFAWAVGPFDVVDGPELPPTKVRATPLRIRAAAPRGHGAELADALKLSGPTLAALEDYFGLAFPYPKLDLVAVPDFWAGAMENPGLITFRDTLLLFREATAPLPLRRFATQVQAHEMAHQWFGDSVTLAWWDEIWLNEAFANWLELPIAQRVRPDYNFPMLQASDPALAMAKDSLTSARQIRQPILTTGEIQNGFDYITYSKGAAVIGMFERYVGREAFRTGVRNYLQAHANGSATADDLLAALSQAAGRDVAGPFHSFLDKPGVPLLEARLECEGGARLKLHQQRYLPVGSGGDPHSTWQVPVCARYPSAGKTELACTLLTAEQGELPLPGPGCPAWVHPNPDNAGYYRWSLPGPQLAALSRAPIEGPDRFSLADNVHASVDAAVLPIGEALAALTPLAKDPEPQVSEPLRGLLELVTWRMASDAERPAAQRLVTSLFRPVLDQVGLKAKPGEDARTTLRRADAVQVLTETAEDPTVHAELAKLGKAYLPDPEGPAHPEAVDPSLAAHALQERLLAEPASFDALAARMLKEQNPTVRRALLLAIAGAPDPALAEKARNLSLGAGLRANELLKPLDLQRHDVRTAPGAWAWLQAHYDVLLPRLADEDRAWLPGLVNGFCSEDKAREVEAFFNPTRMAQLPGAERTLRQALETIRLCSAQVTAHRAGAVRYLADHAPR